MAGPPLNILIMLSTNNDPRRVILIVCPLVKLFNVEAAIEAALFGTADLHSTQPPFPMVSLP